MLTLTIFGSCCKQETNLKDEYLRIGLNNGHETCISIKGNGNYHMEFDNLYSRDVCPIAKIASNVNYFSIISKEEYDNFNNKKPIPTENIIQ
jgi:hypothetical protein